MEIILIIIICILVWIGYWFFNISFRSLIKSYRIVKLNRIYKLGHLDAEFFDILYDLMNYDRGNKIIMKYFKIDKEKMKRKFILLHKYLSVSRSNDGHFIIISIFLYPQTLEYLFYKEIENRDINLITAILSNWFNDGLSHRLVEIDYGQSIPTV
jgi:hypothetical protein